VTIFNNRLYALTYILDDEYNPPTITAVYHPFNEYIQKRILPPASTVLVLAPNSTSPDIITAPPIEATALLVSVAIARIFLRATTASVFAHGLGSRRFSSGGA
jgi:hypothetical protein